MSTIKLQSDIQFLQASAGELSTSPKRFRIVAYTGAPIRQGWSREPVVIDMAGMTLPASVPIVLGHDYSLGSILGQGRPSVQGTELVVEGEILANSDTARQVLALAAAGYQWQASVGADVSRHLRFSEDQATTANGQTHSGPVRIVRASTLREVSIVTLGADGSTAVSIAAEQAAEESHMADTANETPVEEAVKAAATEATAKDAVVPEKVEAAVEYEAKIEALTQKVETMEKLIATRDARGPAIHIAEPVADDRVIEAALCLQGGLPHADKAFDDRTLEAAEKAKRTTSIGEVLVEAARANGYTGATKITSGSAEPILRAAFATHDISNLLSALVNKFLLAGFNAVERSWADISAIRSVNDFKAINLLRLNGDMKFQKIGNAGELKVAKSTDTKRSVAADTWGITTQLTRQDMINDDLNALSQVPQRMGRGAALAMNESIWSEFQADNATYYQKATPASGNALSYSSLEAAVTAYRRLTDPDGNPLAIPPRVLLVPPELEPKAVQLMTQSALIVSALGSTSSKAVEPSANVFAGRYRVITSNYLTSTSTWWLMADAADLPALDVVFLNGQQAPTIEQVVPDYHVLGVALRGWLDFGVTKAESLSTYRMATA